MQQLEAEKETKDKKVGLLVDLLLLTGCGEPISQEAKRMKAKPINCVDAKEDVAALKSERASVLKQVGAGARFIIPVRKRRIRRSGSPWDMNGRVRCHHGWFAEVFETVILKEAKDLLVELSLTLRLQRCPNIMSLSCPTPAYTTKAEMRSFGRVRRRRHPEPPFGLHRLTFRQCIEFRPQREAMESRVQLLHRNRVSAKRNLLIY